MSQVKALLCAGGTGGHLFPAQALAQELKNRGLFVDLATDLRAAAYLDDFPADHLHIIPSEPFSGKNLVTGLGSLIRLGSGYWKSRLIISQTQPHIVVGFGGYPTVAPMMAAAHMNISCILHEQNAVMGRANTFLASRVTAVATGFHLKAGCIHDGLSVIVTGIPLRESAHIASETPFVPPSSDEPFKLLVFGGSQGARFFSDFLPEALSGLDETKRKQLLVVLQSRPENRENVQYALDHLGIQSEVAPFFKNLPERIACAHLILCRAGASSVAELALIGRPSVLVPLPRAQSLNDDQGANAAYLEQTGGATIIQQKDFLPEVFTRILSQAIDHPENLSTQAEKVRLCGVADATERLANMVEQYAGR